jgi:phosphoribosyl 1,2-cyclic phosphodiesterase
LKNHIITFWGVRGSFPTPKAETLGFGGHTSCVELRTAENELIVLDMGTGFLDLGKSLMKEKNSPRTGHIFVSHYHWDHLFGFLGFVPFFDPSKTFKILGKPDNMDSEKILDYILNQTFWPVDMSMMNADILFHTFPDEGLKIRDGLEVTSSLHGHPNGANSYRINIDGKIIVYTTDCEHPVDQLNHNVIDFANDADILIHDAQYTNDELPSHKGWGHSSWQQAVEVAQKAGVKQLVLFHHDPDHFDDVLLKIEKDAQAVFPNTISARQGMELTLPFD